MSTLISAFKIASGRWLAFIALLASMPGLAMAAPDVGVHMEPDTYRAAETYQSMRAAGTQACAAACAEDRRCAAWTVTPPTFRLGPRCELKSSAGQSLARPGYVSGLSGMSQPVTQTVTSAPRQVTPARTTVASQPPRQSQLAGSSQSTASTAYAPVNQLSSAQRGMVYEGPNGPVAMSGMLPPPVSPPQTVQRTVSMSQPAQRAQTTRPSTATPATSTSVPVKRSVTRTVVASAPPTMIARPAEDPARYATRPTERQPTQTVSTAPKQQQTSVVATRPTPRPSNATRSPLPRPRERGAPVYSVQRMGQFPGDYDATAGYVEGVPEDAKVESVRSNDTDRQSGDETSSKSDNEDDSWPEEYPDPLGGPIGSEPLSGS